ncbi:MAG: hypothetical protein ACOH2R_00700 [Pseudomonas sp.]
MKESDWKLYSKLRLIAVERIYDRIFQQLKETVDDSDKPKRERVVDASDVIKAGFKEVTAIFDRFGQSRSSADLGLRLMCQEKLLTKEEISGFSEETQERVRDILSDREITD